ncbi:hypothetical protein BWD13_08780 [Leptospira santarosai serovar Grippotyphosa]|nr:hypothetical protein BWD13_08780 [Leptospira santarosai serovar Grippotyphosa]
MLCKEPSITLRYLRLSRSLWIAHLCFAKNQRFRFAAFGYLALSYVSCVKPFRNLLHKTILS